MDATAREFNQQSSRILAAAEAGETITVTKNGRPVARVLPIAEPDIPPYPTGPIGDSIPLPVFDLGEPVDWDEGRMHYLEGFGE